MCNCQIIKQMWPFIGKYVQHMLKTTVEPEISKVLPSSLTPFQFQTIDVGSVVSDLLLSTTPRSYFH